jgi:peptidyl-prolyl cis-trans isomerase A (cyclophilin A)
MLKKRLLLAACSVACHLAHAADPKPHVLLDTTFGQSRSNWTRSRPRSVKNFLGYVDSGFYNNTIFHRVIPGFMVQGGGFTDKMQQKNQAPIKNEATMGC